jgi:hypothetical protein
MIYLLSIQNLLIRFSEAAKGAYMRQIIATRINSAGIFFNEPPCFLAKVPMLSCESLPAGRQARMGTKARMGEN